MGKGCTVANKIIKQLISISGLKIECPKCGEDFPIKKGSLFSMYGSAPAAAEEIMRERLGLARELKKQLLERQRQLTENKWRKPERASISAQASNFGQISEQILPAFVTFPYKPSDCRGLFEPIDYVVFTNLSAKRRIETIKFVDVKTGRASLTRRQKQIRDRVTAGKVKHKVVDQ